MTSHPIRFANFVDGAFVEEEAPLLPVDDPSTGEVIGEVPDSGSEAVARAVAAARRAFVEGPWARLAPADRAQLLRALAAELESRFDELTDQLIADSGATARLGPMLQVGGPLAHLRDFADMAGLLDHPEGLPIQSTPGLGQWELRREPVGVVGAFSPFNFPLFMTVWKAAPALLAGNTVVLKPSPLTPFGPDAFARACERIGLPDGVFNLVHGDRATGQALVAHPDVALISFTGSTAVGRQVMTAAAATLKDVVLELGGKSPAIALPDAEAELTVRGTLFSSMMQAGQACVATTRLLVPRTRHDEFCELLAARAADLTVGAAAELTTDVGPVISRAQRDAIEAKVAAAVDQGARVVVGGKPPPGVPEGGHYVAPTVLADVSPTNVASCDEFFGPVLSVTAYDTVDEAVRLANDSPYGLAAAVWGADLERARSVAGRIESGLTWINDVAQADVARTPFAGRKQSGVGTELGPEGLFAYTKTKSLYTALDNDVDGRAYGAVGGEWP